MYLTKRPGLNHHQKKSLHSILRMSLKLQIHLSKVPRKRTSFETKSRKIWFNEGKSTARYDK